MRSLGLLKVIVLLGCLVAEPLAARTSIDELAIEHDPTAELYEAYVGDEYGRHMIPLGALEIIEHELVPEKSTSVLGRRAFETYYLPDARRTQAVADYYREQLLTLGQLQYECSGRTCGRSSFWANTVFDQRIINGPQQYQHYFIVELESSGELLMFYIGQRATRKIYVHVELISPEAR